MCPPWSRSWPTPTRPSDRRSIPRCARRSTRAVCFPRREAPTTMTNTPINWDFFDRERPVTVTRAPGRLDVMGGIADYSGALVLEMPIAGATWVTAQPSGAPDVVIESGDIRVLGGESTVTIPLAELVPYRPLAYEMARALLTADPGRARAAYAAGALVVVHAERGRPLRHGLRLSVRSEVPVGKGLSSSAALEVATLEAVA